MGSKIRHCIAYQECKHIFRDSRSSKGNVLKRPKTTRFKQFLNLRWISCPSKGRNALRTRCRGLKPSVWTDHSCVYNKSLSVSQNKLLDGGSIPPRSTNRARGFKCSRDSNCLSCLTKRNKVYIYSKPFFHIGPDWIRQQWKVRH